MAERIQPLYQSIHDDLLAAIQKGDWQEGALLPSEKILAEQYHVSRITCRKAMTLLTNEGHICRIPGKGTFVQHASKEPVRMTLTNTGRAPSPLAHASHPVIGLVLADFDESYGTRLLSGVEKATAANGAFLILRRTYDDQQLEEQTIEELLALGISGLIMQPVHGEHYAPGIIRLVLDHFPIVFIDRHLRGLDAPFVGTDNVSAAQQATDYLLNLGHQRIAFVTPPYDHTTAIEDRVDGFVKSHAEHGIAIDSALMLNHLTATLPCRKSPETIHRDITSIQTLLRTHPDITCIFAAEYNVILLAVEAAKRLGLQIPHELSLICFDSPDSFTGAYPFTHLRQRESTMGHTAVRLLLNQIECATTPSQKVYLDAPLIIGNSTAENNQQFPV